MDLSTEQLLKAQEVGLVSMTGLMFMAGLAGSLHCVAMCGAFATTCSQKVQSLTAYHGGRLISYTLLGVFAGLLGASFSDLFSNPYIKSVPGIFLGLFFILWGFKNLNRGNLKIKLPKKWEQKLTHLYGSVFQSQQSSKRSFTLGFLTAYLPCGLLYGVLMVSLAFQSPLWSGYAMAAFCLGTVPALVLAPQTLKKIIQPIMAKKPLLISASLWSLGLFTITYRIFIAYGQATCH